MNDLRPYICTFLKCSQAGETYASRSAFNDHEISVHKCEIFGSKIKEPLLSRTCIFCEELLSMTDREEHSRHVARHMEGIAFMVVTKPYEDWDFYTDASCHGSILGIID